MFVIFVVGFWVVVKEVVIENVERNLIVAIDVDADAGGNRGTDHSFIHLFDSFQRGLGF